MCLPMRQGNNNTQALSTIRLLQVKEDWETIKKKEVKKRIDKKEKEQWMLRMNAYVKNDVIKFEGMLRMNTYIKI